MIEGLTPLLRAAADGAGARVLRCLAAEGADLEAGDAKGSTALIWVAEMGHAEAVVELGLLGANLDAVGWPGAFDVTAMWMVAQQGFVVVIKALGRFSADVNQALLDGRTPVYAAAGKGRAPDMRRRWRRSGGWGRT